MSCTSPITAYRSKDGVKQYRKTGKWPIVFNWKNGITSHEVKIPCGKCISCKLELSRQWAVRLVNEAQLNEDNTFITLTYSDEHFPNNKSISKITIQKLIKRLRKKYQPKKIRYYLCGEYGEKYSRPHYHICLFNHDFADKQLTEKSGEGFEQYESQDLQKLWKYGRSRIGDLNWETAAYIARYVTKKITGEMADDHYNQGFSITRNKAYTRTPEFALMSRGLGKEWYMKYKSDIIGADKIIIRDNLQVKPPRYYNTLSEKEDWIEYNIRKKKRRSKIVERDFTILDKLAKTRQILHDRKKRSLENANMLHKRYKSKELSQTILNRK